MDLDKDSDTTTRGPRNRRLIALRVVGVLMLLVAALMMGGAFAPLAPWLDVSGQEGIELPDAHRWHDAQWGTLQGFLISGALLALLIRPLRQPVLGQFLVIATGALALLMAPFDSATFLGLIALLLVPAVVVAVLFPDRAAIRSLRPASLRAMNWPLVAVTLAAGAVMAGPAWRWYDLQLQNAPDEHSEFQHWALAGVLGIVLVAAGLLAATGRPGSRALGVIAGVAFVYLGVAAVSVPDHPGSWGTEGGVASIVAGLAVIAATLLWRAEMQPAVRRGPAMSGAD